MADKKPDEPEKGSEQGEIVDAPEPIAAEDAVGAQETPTERQQEREQAIADEPVAESEQRIAEAAAPAAAGEGKAPLGPTEDVNAEDEDDEPATPRVKPEIPGMDLEPDIVLDGEERDEYGLDDAEGSGDETDEDELPQPIADASIDLAVHHHKGDVLDEDAMRAMALHEIGHLLGLDHTYDVRSIMAPKVRVRTLSSADKATVRLLYTLPPGAVR